MVIKQIDFQCKPDDQVLLKLGLVLARASQVEYLLRLLIKDIASKDFTVGMEKTVGRSNADALKSQLSELFVSGNKCVNKFNKEDTTEFRKIIHDIVVWAGSRNKITHAKWTDKGIKVTDSDCAEFHKHSAKLMNKIESFRKSRYHDETETNTFTPWSVQCPANS